jgi:hypothetical protein
VIIDFAIGVLLLGSLLHLTFGIWRVRMISPFGFSGPSNILYGVFVLSAAVGLYFYQHGLSRLAQDYIMLGSLFAIAYAVALGVWLRFRGRI